MSDDATTYPRVLVRGEDSGGRLGIVESLMPPGAGPPLHEHEFDEAFYVVAGELTFSVAGELVTKGAGEFAFAPGGVPHTFANLGPEPAHYLMTITPAGFECEFARRAARKQGIDVPEWARGEIPEVTILGPPIGESK